MTVSGKPIRPGLIETAERTMMFQEAADAPAAIERQFKANAAIFRRLGDTLRARSPRAVVTVGRGSSDHAATLAKYLIETRLGILTSSAAPSINSVYSAKQDLANTVFLAISQSGTSPDIIATVEAAKAQGAFVIALVNAESSALAKMAHEVVPLRAGAEHSVAATKSLLASLAAILQLVAFWGLDAELHAALAPLPDLLMRAWHLDWSAMIPNLVKANDLYVLARGLGFCAAQEIALKFKETCGLHAEAFSAAEVRHGPMALVQDGFPVFVLSQDDETRASLKELTAKLIAQNADVFLAGFFAEGTSVLPTIVTDPALQPLLLVQTAYRLINALSLARGFDPDHPPHLRKVTKTL